MRFGKSGYARVLGGCSFALLATSIFSQPARAAHPLSLHVPDAVLSRRATLVARPDSARQMHLAITLPMHDLAGLDALLKQIYDPASPQFRHYLSVPEFAARFSPSSADYNRAAAYLAAQGLHVTGTAANRYLIDVAGKVSDIERVLHVRFGLYQHPTQNRLFIAPDREPSLDLAVPIQHITGLDDFAPPVARRAQRRDSLPSARVRTGSGPGGNFIASDIRAAYYGTGSLTGTGQSVGLMELGPYNPVDITTYFRKFGPAPATVVAPISTDGSPATCTGVCDDGEQALDIEFAIGMAPGLDQVQVYTATSAESVLNRMASDNTSAQLSTSWGWKEDRATDEPLFMEMAAQGQTLLTASGDYSTLKASGPWPEESAYLTGVGGTDLVTKSRGGAWRRETGWADSAGGPSYDKSIKIPYYQTSFINAANGGSLKLRNVPDIGGDADFNNYECYDLTCEGGWGGTSFASPIWAGFIALANQQAAAQGYPRVGFLNPLLYTLGLEQQYPRLFHDTIGGASGLYTAVAGFDLVAGFGSPNGTNMINALMTP